MIEKLLAPCYTMHVNLRVLTHSHTHHPYDNKYIHGDPLPTILSHQD